MAFGRSAALRLWLCSSCVLGSACTAANLVSRDAGSADALGADARALDAAAADADDAGTVLFDSASADAGTADAGLPDGGSGRDARAADGGAIDAGPVEPMCEPAPDAGPPASGRCALLMSGPDSRAVVSGDSMLLPLPFTVEAWVWFDRWPVAFPQQVFYAEDGYGLVLEATPTEIACRLRDSASGSWESAAAPVAAVTVAPRTWVHVACARDVGQLYLTIDATLVASALSSLAHMPLTRLAIGGDAFLQPRSHGMVGLIDDARISGEVLYPGKTTRPPRPLRVEGATVALWSFDECEGGVARNATDATRYVAALDCGASWADQTATFTEGVDLSRAECGCCAGAEDCAWGDVACGTWHGPESDRNVELRACVAGRDSGPVRFVGGAGWANGDAACAALGLGSCRAVVDWGCFLFHCCAEVGPTRAVLCATE